MTEQVPGPVPLEKQPHLVIYHGGQCWDGLCSAWLLRRFAPWGKDAEYVAAQYGDDPPAVKGKHVLIVDFSWPRHELERMYAEAESLLVLDHHKTAEAALKDLPFAHFSSDRSGCGMVWEWLMEQELVLSPCPPFVEYIEDRDLWRWEKRESRYVNAAIRSHPLTFKTLDGWSKWKDNDLWYAIHSIEGEGISRMQDRIIEGHVERAKCANIDGIRLLIVNCTVPEFASDVGQALAAKSPSKIGAFFFVMADGQAVMSLRSTADGPDVSAIAAKFPGGGGHKHAAGFTVSLATLEKFLFTFTLTCMQCDAGSEFETASAAESAGWKDIQPMDVESPWTHGGVCPQCQKIGN